MSEEICQDCGSLIPEGEHVKVTGNGWVCFHCLDNMFNESENDTWRKPNV